MHALRAFILDEHRRHPWMAPSLALSASAALGTALPDILDLLAAVLR